MNAKLIATAVALATGAPAFAQTYWLNKGNDIASPPKCFKFYSDEACTTEVSDIKPAANDGNTYVVLGSQKMGGGYTAPAGTTWFFGTDGETVGTKKAAPWFHTNGGVTLDFGNCTIYGITACCNGDNRDGTLTWGGVNTLVNCGQTFEFRSWNMSSKPRGVVMSGTFSAAEDVTIKMTRETGAGEGVVPSHKISGDFTAYKGNIALGAGTSATRLNALELTSATAFGDASVERADYLTVENWTRWTIGSGVTQLATKGIQLSLSGDGTSAMYAADGASWTLSAPVTTSSTGGGGSKRPVRAS